MRTKKLNERCENIFDFFCQISNADIYVDDIPLVDFISPFRNEFSKQIPIIISKEDRRIDLKVEEIEDLFWPAIRRAFSFGYVIGQSFEITGPDAKNDLEAIQKIIREKAILPYLPREKKAQATLTK
jgi:hypothetical protein